MPPPLAIARGSHLLVTGRRGALRFEAHRESPDFRADVPVGLDMLPGVEDVPYGERVRVIGRLDVPAPRPPGIPAAIGWNGPRILVLQWSRLEK